MNAVIRRATALAAVAAMGLGMSACGDDSEASGDATTTVAPEDVKVPLTEVIAGLPAVAAAGQEAADQAADGDFDAATAAYEEAHEAWEDVEGTVKDTDPDTYEAIETALGLIADGADSQDASRTADGATDLAAAIDSFITDQS